MLSESKLMIDRSEMVSVFRRLSLEAGEIVMKFYDSESFDIKLKADNSPVTAADKEADTHISRGILEYFSNVPLVTEEQVQTHTSKYKSFIIVDPLDGTKEFINRNGDFTVNIAYVENGEPLVGVVYAPAKKRLFYTLSTSNAVEEYYPFDKNIVGEIKLLKPRVPDNDNLIMVASKSHQNQETKDYISKYNISTLMGAGSSLKFCLLASGEADIYPRLGRTMEWDTAAGQAILNSAGGKVVKFNDHSAMLYGKTSYENPFFVAYVPGVKLRA
jgi:3'(2'), 5'-bisphosphate nucleotidase